MEEKKYKSRHTIRNFHHKIIKKKLKNAEYKTMSDIF